MHISPVGYFFITVYCLILLRVIFIYWQADKLKGSKIGKTFSPIDKLVKRHKKVVVYFYSPYCPQCVGMGEAVTKLSQYYDNIIKIDLSENRHLSKILNIRATPTLLLIIKGHIQSVYLGARTESFIKDILDHDSPDNK